jgi:hypothetical protein
METAKCELCGEPMPPGEEMFKMHGYSGACPKPPLPHSGEGAFKPGECANCGCKVSTDAEAFIHACLHSGDEKWAEWGSWTKLNRLPFILFPIVGKLMEAYKEHI